MAIATALERVAFVLRAFAERMPVRRTRLRRSQQEAEPFAANCGAMRISPTKFVVNPAILPQCRNRSPLWEPSLAVQGRRYSSRGSSVDSTGRLCNPQRPAWAVCGATATPRGAGEISARFRLQ